MALGYDAVLYEKNLFNLKKTRYFYRLIYLKKVTVEFFYHVICNRNMITMVLCGFEEGEGEREGSGKNMFCVLLFHFI